MKTFLTEYEENENSSDFKDICFYTLYKDGYSWFASTAHERCGWIYIKDEQTYFDLKNLGANLSYLQDVDESKLFLEESLKVIVKDFR